MRRVREQISCPSLNECNFGNPVTIAFLDTGVKRHPDLSDRIIAFKDFVKGRSECYDDSGHGTHVCGIAAGNGNLSEGKYCGIAPMSRIVMGKVLDENGDGMIKQMIEGLEWLIRNKDLYKIKVINISVGVGSLQDKKKEEELTTKLEEVWNAGILVICAAGNLGPKPGSISPLGSSRKVITVGCHDGEFFKNNENRCETYSGRGPTKDTIKKPDIVAPGTEIISCNGFVYKQGKKYYNSYISKSGTSMATAIVSATAALIWQKYPSLTHEQVKRKLLYSASDLKEPWTKQGWGMINIKRALE